MAIISEVGDGACTLFWKDRWINGQQVADLAPQIFAIVNKRNANKRTVLEALTNHGWIADIQGALTVGIITEFLALWDILSEVTLQLGVEDAHVWRLSASANIRQNLHIYMRPSSLAPLHSDHGSVFGKLGLLESAASLCVWQHITNAGQQTGLHAEVSHILPAAPTAIKRKKLSIIC